MSSPRLEPLSQEECMAVLSTATVGRVAVNIEALPTVLPVHFALLEGSVIFPTAPGTKLHSALQHAVVAFQADHYGDIYDPMGWSVLIRGVAQSVTDPTLRAAADLLPLPSWGAAGSASHYVRVEPAIVTGRRFVL